MTLAQRLALLKGKRPAGSPLSDNDVQRDGGTGPLVTQSHVPLPLHERLLRLQGMNGGSRKTADETGGRRHSDTEVARHLQGEVVAPGLIQVDQTIPLASRHGKFEFSLLTGMSFAALGLPDATPPGGLLFLDTETTGL